MSSAHSASEAERISQEERMFAFVHSAQDDGWRPVGDAIAMYTNPFSAQWEHDSMISPADSITETSLAWWSEERLGAMMSNKEH